MQNGQIDLDKIIFAIESIDSIKDEIMDLARIHQETTESELYKDLDFLEVKLNELDPDWDRYALLENNNSLIIFTARLDGKLIGYNIFFLSMSLHYKTQYVATQNLIFIHPDNRGFGKYFIFYSDEKLKEIGVKKIFYILKAANDWSEKLLKPLGYTLMDKIYGRKL